MKPILQLATATILISIGMLEVMATEEARYDVVKKAGEFELRDYASQIVAQTEVEGTLEEAGGKAFNRLFRYISGANRPRRQLAMTAPVSQQQAGQKIEMTAPVGQQRTGDNWLLSFMMPDAYTLETLPEPDDPRVTLRAIPARRMAAVRYSGLWSEKNYRRHRTELESWIDNMNLSIVGEAIWARYNSPFMLWFLRRNEILIPVAAGTVSE